MREKTKIRLDALPAAIRQNRSLRKMGQVVLLAGAGDPGARARVDSLVQAILLLTRGHKAALTVVEGLLEEVEGE